MRKSRTHASGASNRRTAPETTPVPRPVPIGRREAKTNVDENLQKATSPKRTPREPQVPALKLTKRDDDAKRIRKIQNDLRNKFFEKSASVHKLFRQIDADKSGSVSREELEQGLKDFGWVLSDEEKRAFYLMVDADNSGEVSYAEFADALIVNEQMTSMAHQDEIVSAAVETGIKHQEEPARPVANAGLPTLEKVEIADLQRILRNKFSEKSASIRKLFRAMDEDKSGTISHAELEKGLKEMHLNLSQEELVALYTLVDENNSGEISYSEFSDGLIVKTGYDANYDVFEHHRKRVVPHKGEQPQLDAEALRNSTEKMNLGHFGASQHRIMKAMRAVDTKHNGIIPADAFKRALQSVHAELTHTELEAIVAKADSTDTGMVNFRDFMDVVVHRNVEDREDAGRWFVPTTVKGGPMGPARRRVIHSPGAVKGPRGRTLDHGNFTIPVEGCAGYESDNDRHQRTDIFLQESQKSKDIHKAKLARMRQNAEQVQNEANKTMELKMQKADANLKHIQNQRERFIDALWTERYKRENLDEMPLALKDIAKGLEKATKGQEKVFTDRPKIARGFSFW